MTASADGVHLEVTNTIGEDAYLVASPVQENPTMTIPPGTSTVFALTPPGEVRLHCGAGRDRLDRSVTVTVEDPHGFYRSVDLAEALGCKPDSTVDSHDAGWGSTAREAAEAFVAQLGADVEVTAGNGYRDHDRKELIRARLSTGPPARSQPCSTGRCCRRTDVYGWGHRSCGLAGFTLRG